MTIWSYIDAHPLYTFFLGFFLLVFTALVVPMIFNLIRFLVNRPLRHVTLWIRGWPPEHLDADGDFKPKEKDDAKEEKEEDDDRR